MHRIIGVTLLFTFLLATPGAAVSIIKDGKTDRVIVIAADATPAEKTAAKELADFLNQVTGATLEIKTEDEVPSIRPQILVGPSKRARQLLTDVDWTKLSPDGIVMREVGNNLVLAGDRPRGTLYAVYSFLEDIVGCKWWTSTESTIPKKPTIDTHALNVTYVPKLKYRETYNHDPIHKPIFAARLKLNGHMSTIPPEYGGNMKLLGWCHTSFELIHPNAYFGAHPEWFAMINGKRQGGTQLCLTDEAMRKELVRHALEWIKKDPNAGMISISQNDTAGPCQCDKCQAIVKAEGSEAGPWIVFCNAVADEITKQYPNFLVETLAYQYTRTPPKNVKPSNKVIVRLCSIECDFAHPLEGPSNAAFGNDLRGWAKIAPNLFIWNYVTSFANYLIPHPNMSALGPDLRFFINNNVIGVFEQGDAYNEGTGDFLQLRAWLLAHLMWGPERNATELRNEFLLGYYGAAGPFLMQYLDMVNTAGDDPNFRLSTYNGSTSFLSDEEIERATNLFDRAAEAVADDTVLSRRVRRERLGLDYVKLLRYNFAGKLAAAQKNNPNPSIDDVCADYDARLEDWIKTSIAMGTKSISEGGAFDSYVPSLRMRCQAIMPPKLPEPGAKLNPGEFDIQEDKFTLHNRPASADIVDDPKASNGKASRMPGGHVEWATQYQITKDSPALGVGPWKCYIVARVVPKQKAGGAFAFGLHDSTTNAYLARDTATFDLAGDGEYHTYGIFINELKPGMYFWVSPPGNPATVDSIYIDRIYIQKK